MTFDLPREDAIAVTIKPPGEASLDVLVFSSLPRTPEWTDALVDEFATLVADALKAQLAVEREREPEAVAR